MATKDKDRGVTMKIPRRAYEAALDLTAYTAKHGWLGLGAEREDTPTLYAIIEEAVLQLAARVKRGEKKR